MGHVFHPGDSIGVLNHYRILHGPTEALFRFRLFRPDGSTFVYEARPAHRATAGESFAPNWAYVDFYNMPGIWRVEFWAELDGDPEQLITTVDLTVE